MSRQNPLPYTTTHNNEDGPVKPVEVASLFSIQTAA